MSGRSPDQVRRTAQGCKGVSPLAQATEQNAPFCVRRLSCLCFSRTKNAVHTAYTMTHIITHNSKHTAHIITHTLTHKKDHNPIDTPQNNPHKRRANHFAVFVPQPFRAVDKLAVGESHEVHEVHEVRTYTNYTSFRLSCGLRRSKNRETAGIFGTGCGNVGPRTRPQTFPTWSGLRPDTLDTVHAKSILRGVYARETR